MDTPSSVKTMDRRLDVVVATDMDGTLCEMTEVHEETHAAIEKLKLHEVLILPVTGRGPQLATNILDAVNLPAYPAGYHHGALTYNTAGEVILDLTIPSEVLGALIVAVDRMVEEKNIFAAVIAQCKNTKYAIYEHSSMETSIVALRWDMATVDAENNVIPSSGSKDRPPGRVATRGDMTQEDLNGIYQGTILNQLIQPPEIIEWQKAILNETFERHGLKNLKTHASGRYFIDTIHSDADKSSAIVALADDCDFALENVVALGDNQNDIGMMKVAGKSVAMGNARDDVKACADYVTDHVSEGGWGRAIEKMVFSNVSLD